LLKSNFSGKSVPFASWFFRSRPSTPNFDVYYYEGGNDAAIRVAEYAESELKRITNLVGYYPYSKTTLMLYNSITDLRQSNVGLNPNRYQTGGDALFLKNKIEIAFEESQVVYKKQITYRLSQQLINDMMYGGSLKEVLQSSYLLRLPEWFVDGVSAYIAEGWSVEMDGYMRDMMEKTKGKKAETVFLRNQKLSGQSVWNYITERYGYTAIQNILNLTRITRDIEIGISSSLNVPYRKFMRDWNTHYLQINTQPTAELISLTKDSQLTRTNRRGLRYSETVFSPDGTKLAYAVNDLGRYKIVVQTVATGKKNTIKHGGYKTPDQKVNYNLPVLAWRDNNTVSVVEEKKGQLVLTGLKLNAPISLVPAFLSKNKPNVTNLSQFSAVNSMHYSEDVKQLVLSAVKKGQTDLFIYRNSKLPEQLTNDIFDEQHPVFLKGSNTIAFASNRWLDSLGTAPAVFNSTVDNYDIFLYNPDKKGYRFKQLTSTISNETQPVAVTNGLLFLSEESGIRSLHRYDFTAGLVGKVSNYLQNIERFDFEQNTGSLVLTASERSRQGIYLVKAFAGTAIETPFKTVRQETLEFRSRQPIIRESLKRNPPIDTTTHKAKTEKLIDVQNYQFDTSEKAPEKTTVIIKNNTAVNNGQNPAEQLQITGPYKYDLRFAIDNVGTGFYIDPLMGFGLTGQVNMSDLFEDHRIRGGAFTTTDFRTTDFYGEYLNLKKRYDLRITYRRQTIFEPLETNYFRYSRHEFKPTVSYPLTHSISIKALPQFISTRRTVVTSLAEADSVSDFFAFGGELVFDNSIVTGINMSEGTRMKIGLMTYKSTSNKQENFGKIYADLRHYQKLHKQIILANRISYGAFVGNAPKNYLLGGMDNWIFSGGGDPVTSEFTAPDVFFMEYALPLRGFSYNQRNGPKHLLYNAELRIPIVQYLFRSPVYSGFFNNLQLIGFFDAGTAYAGTNPFNRNNNYNTQVIGGGGNPFEATVINYRNPFLYGYGFGIRTTLLGVYGKLDVAWNEEDYQKGGPFFHLTMGYDF